MASVAVSATGYGADGVYHSLRLAAPIASDPGLFLTDLLFHRADACPSALVLVDVASGRALTFADLRTTVLTTAIALSFRAGVCPGDTVLLVAPNCVLYLVCFFATTANPLYTPREIAKQVSDAHAKVIITILPKIAELRLPVIFLDDDATAAASVPSDANITRYSDLIAGV